MGPTGASRGQRCAARRRRNAALQFLRASPVPRANRSVGGPLPSHPLYASLSLSLFCRCRALPRLLLSLPQLLLLITRLGSESVSAAPWLLRRMRWSRCSEFSSAVLHCSTAASVIDRCRREIPDRCPRALSRLRGRPSSQQESRRTAPCCPLSAATARPLHLRDAQDPSEVGTTCCGLSVGDETAAAHSSVQLQCLSSGIPHAHARCCRRSPCTLPRGTPRWNHPQRLAM